MSIVNAKYRPAGTFGFHLSTKPSKCTFLCWASSGPWRWLLLAAIRI